MRRSSLWGALALPLACLIAPSCSSPESLGRGNDIDGGLPSSPTFSSPDASADAQVNELTAYCPSNKCPEGWTTCPDSIFPCDVNLKTDLDNCGACGSSCVGPTTAETFECVEGHCA